MWGRTMKTIYDIQQFLKRFGTIIYTGERVADLELMEFELKELFHSQLIDNKEFQTVLFLLRHEIQLEKENLEKRKR